jgi:hypothetical protein
VRGRPPGPYKIRPAMRLDHRRTMTPEQLEALYARLNELIDHATEMRIRLGKAISHAPSVVAAPVVSTRQPKRARRSRTSKSRN